MKITQVGTQVNSLGTTTSVEGLEKFVTFLAGGTITAGQWVSFDISQTGLTQLSTVVASPVVATGNVQVVGVATAAASSGNRVVVQVAGYYVDASVADAVVVGDPLIAAGTTAGLAEKAAATDVAPICGWAVTDGSGSNLAAVFVSNPAGL